MVLNAYSLYDSKAVLYSQPWFLINDAFAIRAVVQLAREPGTSIHDYPTDFSLFHLGTFDDTLGGLTSVNPRNLGLVSTLLAE